MAEGRVMSKTQRLLFLIGRLTLIVLVIALFYTRELAWDALGIAGLVLLLLVILNAVRVRRLTPLHALSSSGTRASKTSQPTSSITTVEVS